MNAGGRTKLVGTAQRIVKGGWLFAASVVVRDPEPVRAVLEAVYERLGIAWDPATVGAVADDAPAAARADVEEAFVRAFGGRHRLEPAELDAATLAAARRRASAHRHQLAARGGARRTRSARRTTASACCGPRRRASGRASASTAALSGDRRDHQRSKRREPRASRRAMSVGSSMPGRTSLELEARALEQELQPVRV